MTNPKPKTAIDAWHNEVEKYNKHFPEGSKLYLQDVIEELDQRLRQLEDRKTPFDAIEAIKHNRLDQLEEVAEPPSPDLSEVITLMKGFLKEYEKPAWWRSDQQWHAMREAIAILERAKKDGGK